MIPPLIFLESFFEIDLLENEDILTFWSLIFTVFIILQGLSENFPFIYVSNFTPALPFSFKKNAFIAYLYDSTH